MGYGEELIVRVLGVKKDETITLKYPSLPQPLTIVLLNIGTSDGINEKHHIKMFANNKFVGRAVCISKTLFRSKWLVYKLFSPELLNRIDEKIVFHTLDEDNVLSIVDLQLKELIDNLEKIDLSINITKRARKLLAKLGFHNEYGARNLRRTIQNYIEDSISELLLENKFVQGDKITVDVKKNEFIFSSKQKNNAQKRKKITNENPQNV